MGHHPSNELRFCGCWCCEGEDDEAGDECGTEDFESANRFVSSQIKSLCGFDCGWHDAGCICRIAARSLQLEVAYLRMRRMDGVRGKPARGHRNED